MADSTRRIRIAAAAATRAHTSTRRIRIAAAAATRAHSSTRRIRIAAAAAVLAIVVSLDPRAAADPTGAAQRQQRVLESLRPQMAPAGAHWTLAERMARHHVPGVAIAVISNFEIDWVAGFGVRDTSNAATAQPVTKDTVFQAGSISKPVAAMGALALMQTGKLALDAPIAKYLKSWTLPENEFTKAVPLTMAHILSHTGGVTVHGFLGYTRYEAIPTVPQILDGTLPANSPPIFVDTQPGGPFRYAGGGTTILQQAILDVTGAPFPATLKSLVFDPLGLSHSTYEQPLPVSRFPDHSAAHLIDGKPTPGSFHVHPELCAAGLWVSAEDLAKIVIDLQRSLRDDSGKVLTQDTVRRMTTPVGGGPTGLGVFVEDHRGDIYFAHNGANVGFRNAFFSHRDKGCGVVVLTNSDGGEDLLPEVVNAVAEVYAWPTFFPTDPIALAKPDPAAEAEELKAAPGRYEISADETMVIRAEGDRLFVQFPPDPVTYQDRLYRVGPRTYYSMDRRIHIRFDEPGDKGFEDAYLGEGKDAKYLERLQDDAMTPCEAYGASKLDEGAALYRAMAKADPSDRLVNPDRMTYMTMRWIDDGPVDAALALARVVVEIHPEDPFGWFTLGRACAAKGDEAGAKKAFETAVARVEANFKPEEAARHSVRAMALAALAEASGKEPHGAH